MDSVCSGGEVHGKSSVGGSVTEEVLMKRPPTPRAAPEAEAQRTGGGAAAAAHMRSSACAGTMSAAGPPGRSTRRAHSSGPPPVPAPAEVTLRPNMAARAQEVRSLPIGTSPAAAGQPTPAAGTASRSAREPACADTDIRKSARDHYLANKLFVLLSKNIRVRRRALAARSPSQHGVAHANRFPAAGRLMRAGRAGAGGGSDACAHHRPSLSADAPPPQSERDGDNSLSQRRLVNTNRPRSRDKYSTFTSRRTRARALIASRQFPTHARCSQIARGRRRAAAAPPVCYI
ncbi:hypothetical protein PYW07_013916 [Mythimna separata]|uniref:Uncharacterized protein n=1 Tax=Mythimna separata TaxID=271217 RepID=A0AAD7YF06_MYTSE|nr:hypothetical protein PYW07_013916 [Mythimna separata]